MSTTILTLFTTYLIFPILAIVLGVVAGIAAKKAGLMSNKRLIAFVLGSVALLAVPGLTGFLEFNFMPYWYIVLTALYLLLGSYNYNLMQWAFKKEVKFRVKIIMIVFQALAGMMLFAMIFNLCSNLKYGFWASTPILTFVLIAVLMRSYQVFINIPAAVYKLWRYETAPSHLAPDNIDHLRMKLIKVEVGEHPPVDAKFMDDMVFGEWIKLFFENHNVRYMDTPIDFHSRGGAPRPGACPVTAPTTTKPKP